MGKPEPHPVKSFVGGTDEGFIQMLAKTVLGEERIKFPYGLAKMPAGAGKNNKVIHIAGLVQMRLVRKMHIHVVQMKGAQQWTE
ncbi:hypothetical protein B4916_22835 [Yersinia intermedia]|nr:hypothetical protein B4916_22835 [Yersinia intermedia]